MLFSPSGFLYETCLSYDSYEQMCCLKHSRSLCNAPNSKDKDDHDWGSTSKMAEMLQNRGRGITKYWPLSKMRWHSIVISHCERNVLSVSQGVQCLARLGPVSAQEKWYVCWPCMILCTLRKCLTCYINIFIFFIAPMFNFHVSRSYMHIVPCQGGEKLSRLINHVMLHWVIAMPRILSTRTVESISPYHLLDET